LEGYLLINDAHAVIDTLEVGAMFRSTNVKAARVNHKNGNGRLSGKMLEYLERKYQLSPQDMLHLRVVYSASSWGKLPARFIRIYDQRTLTNGIRTYEDLENHLELILYQGHILNNDFVYVTKCDTNAVYQGS
jgi:hypothetical protein